MLVLERLVMKAATENLQNMDTMAKLALQVWEFANLNAEGRVATYMLAFNGYIYATEPEISKCIGVSRGLVSTILSSWHKRGWIEKEKRVRHPWRVVNSVPLEKLTPFHLALPAPVTERL